jgi:endogenous inhibitor of DNA gyrase (YacG/DUF329 family)
MSRASDDRRCPICSRAQAVEYRPFCSKRCADIDLGRWLGGGYAIPAAEDEDGPSAGEDGDEREGGAA